MLQRLIYKKRHHNQETSTTTKLFIFTFTLKTKQSVIKLPFPGLLLTCLPQISIPLQFDGLSNVPVTDAKQ